MSAPFGLEGTSAFRQVYQTLGAKVLLHPFTTREAVIGPTPTPLGRPGSGPLTGVHRPCARQSANVLGEVKSLGELIATVDTRLIGCHGCTCAPRRSAMRLCRERSPAAAADGGSIFWLEFLHMNLPKIDIPITPHDARARPRVLRRNIPRVSSSVAPQAQGRGLSPHAAQADRRRPHRAAASN
jgi:hypothetical protein